jgi:hypothetical protein
VGIANFFLVGPLVANPLIVFFLESAKRLSANFQHFPAAIIANPLTSWKSANVFLKTNKIKMLQNLGKGIFYSIARSCSFLAVARDTVPF